MWDRRRDGDPSSADPAIPFSVFEGTRRGLRSLQPLRHRVPCPEGEAGLGTETNGAARRLPRERSMTSPGAVEEFPFTRGRGRISFHLGLGDG